jgi:hypothetical protein
MTTENYRSILKRVGLILMAVGVVAVCYMIYCITHGQSYSSSFNVTDAKLQSVFPHPAPTMPNVAPHAWTGRIASPRADVRTILRRAQQDTDYPRQWR